MKIVRFETSAPRERVLEAIKNSNEVNRNVKFDDKLGRPLIKVKEKQGSSELSCAVSVKATLDFKTKYKKEECVMNICILIIC